MRELKYIPNRPGFRFVGIVTGNIEVDCFVWVFDGCHKVGFTKPSEYTFQDLIGWHPL